jgi:hypothetical protein
VILTESYPDGDVIGCELDRTNNTVSYYRNGLYLGVAFEHLPRDIKLFPAVMLGQYQECRLNFGRDERRNILLRKDEPDGFAFAPQGVRPMHDLLGDDAFGIFNDKVRRHNSFIPKQLWTAGVWCQTHTLVRWLLWFAKDKALLDLLLGKIVAEIPVSDRFASLSIASERGNALSLEYLLHFRTVCSEEEVRKLAYFALPNSPMYVRRCLSEI